MDILHSNYSRRMGFNPASSPVRQKRSAGYRASQISNLFMEGELLLCSIWFAREIDELVFAMWCFRFSSQWHFFFFF